jgi:SAM-dependent methyltransferase
MTVPLSDWLALREPADAAARSVSLTRTVAEAVSSHASIRVLDLGSGTGANLRYLAERLAPRQEWLLTDVNPDLLERVRERTASWAAERGYEVAADGDALAVRGRALDCRVAVRQLDLNTLPAELFAGRHLVTASALLDLVSEPWLRTLAARCRAEHAAALFALNYDGRSWCSPGEPEDDLMRDGLNRHQLKDKGLGGPATGPAADRVAVRVFEHAGYRAQREEANWELGAEHRELQRQLLDGWAEATLELEPARASTIAAWRKRRHAHLDAGRSTVVVGHHDVAAWLPQRPPP